MNPCTSILESCCWHQLFNLVYILKIKHVSKRFWRWRLKGHTNFFLEQIYYIYFPTGFPFFMKSTKIKIYERVLLASLMVQLLSLFLPQIWGRNKKHLNSIINIITFSWDSKMIQITIQSDYFSCTCKGRFDF